MPAAPKCDLGQTLLVVLEFFQGDVTQGMDAGQVLLQIMNSSLAMGTPAVVFTGGQIVLDLGVADHDADPFVNFQRLILETAAIEQ